MLKWYLNGHKWLFFVAFCMVMFCVQSVNAQGVKQELVEAFLKDAIDMKIPDEQLIKKYMCNDLPIPKDEKARGAHEFFTQQVYRFRMMLLGQSKKITDNFGNAITAYKNLPENERNVMIEEKDEDNVFRFKGEQNLVFNILVSNGRILTFTTMNKGDRWVFLMLCA
ncbi:MAG: hypothetical protein H7289_13790 [Mucilaginibacter sp.]|nr:hypothetical protein [Mucilaginibacter sp.]